MSGIDEIVNCEEFEWDEWNSAKIWSKHGIGTRECEEVFLSRPLLLAHDDIHSTNEKRYYALGHTNSRRLLFVVVTVRNNRLRVVTARDMTSQEQEIYESQ